MFTKHTSYFSRSVKFLRSLSIYYPVFIHYSHTCIDYASVIDYDRIYGKDKIVLDGNEFLYRIGGPQIYPEPEEYIRRDHEEVRYDRRMEAYIDTIRRTAPNEDSPDHILNTLSDDCLIDTFYYFNLHDLCTMANVCERFNEIAIKVFCATYKKRADILYDLICQNREPTSLSLAQIEIFIKTFGHEMNAFETRDLLELGMCAEHCTKLNILDLYVGSSWYHKPHAYLRRLLPQLKQLTLYWSDVSAHLVDDLLVADSQIETLDLTIHEPHIKTTIIKLPNVNCV